MESPRNFKIEGVELNWVKLSKPVVNAFNKNETLWEMQIATTDKAKAEELKKNHINMKEKDGKFVASLRRKTVKADGSANDPVRVVNSDLSPMLSPEKIGNGSIANVIVYQYPWSNMGRTGIGSILSAVQITALEEYTPTGGVDFAPVGEPAAEETAGDPVEMF